MSFTASPLGHFFGIGKQYAKAFSDFSSLQNTLPLVPLMLYVKFRTFHLGRPGKNMDDYSVCSGTGKGSLTH